MMQVSEVPVLPLRDIRLPAEPGFWPLAPGWWVLITVSLIVLAWLTLKTYQHLKKKRRWQQIEQQLADIEFDFNQSNNKQKLLTETSVFLRRFVKFQLKQNQASTLSGQDWIEHLDQLQNDQSFEPFKTALTSGVYQDSYEYDADQLLSTTHQFIKKQVMKPNKKQSVEAINV